MFTIPLPPAPLTTLWVLERAGFPAYIVGGCLRDALMDRTPHDWDVTTAALPDQMLEIFRAAGLSTIPTGLQHGTVTVLVDHCPVECTTYRLDGDYTDARHPDSVRFTDRIADDLCRRDFTFNAMACRLPALREMDAAPDGLTVYEDEVELLDLHGGRADLAARVLRCVGDPQTRFTEDALRILRGVRFSVQLGFAVDGETEQALAATASGLGRISVERIAAELTRMLDCPAPSRGLMLMSRTGLWSYVLPEVDLSKKPYFTSENDLYLAADALPCDHALRLALLLSGRTPEEARAACRRLKLSNELTDAVSDLVAITSLPLPADEPALRRSMARFGDRFERGLALFAVCHSDQREVCEATLATARVIRARGDCLALSTLAVDGRDLMDALGLRGRQVGATLHALLDAVLDDPKRNDREALLALARQMGQN